MKVTITNHLTTVSSRLLITGLSLAAATAVPMKGSAELINGVNYDVNGRSEVVWSDDSSYGIQVFNELDSNGDIRTVEYAKVNDSNFTRDSFTLNTDYTFSPLNNVLVNSGVASDENSAKLLYSDGLNDSGALNPGSGWMLVDNSDGTDNIEGNGDPGLDYDIPTLGDYAVRERTLNANNVANNSSAYIDSGMLFNDQGQFYGQVKFDTSGNGVNLTSYDAVGGGFQSTGVDSNGIQVVPEPTTMSLIGLLGAGLLVARRLYDKR